MNAPSYEPRPLDATDVALSSDLLQLEERLARNAHEVWAKQRMDDGWTYGPRRDDDAKHHPCLVPYEDLPESEKAYDRRLAHTLLQAIVGLGYTIQAAAGETPTPQDRGHQSVQLEVGPGQSLTSLLGIWQARDIEQWHRGPEAYRILAERLLGLGEPLLAYDVTSEGLESHPNDRRLRQLQALALARSGATRRANVLLRELHAEDANDEETVGMLARTEKDFGLTASDPAVRQAHLAQAAALYADFFERHGGYWTGINAATLYTLLDQTQRATSLARDVRNQCLSLQTSTGAADYWLVATLGEAELVLGNQAEAAEWYARAAALGRSRLGDLASTYRNARLLLDHTPALSGPLANALRMPTVALFKGGGAIAAASLREQLEEPDCLIGYASLASLADVEFFEILLERGGTACVVVPYAPDEYLQTRATVAGAPSYLERAQSVLARAASVTVASPYGVSASHAGAEFTANLLDGLARTHARRLETRVVELGSTESSQGTPTVLPDSGSSEETLALLFADAVHFSRLAEREIQRFADHFLSAIGKLVVESPHAPVFRNTWGDGLFFVFRTVRDAGAFALELCDVINHADWSAVGLPSEMNLRIGLHAGPVVRWMDPITGRIGYLGTHISRAARIEPITPPGHVYASEAFAALAELVPERAFVCEYVGQTPQAKGYGTFPTYHVRRI